MLILLAKQILFLPVLQNDIDVLFLCVGHGDAKKFLAENTIAATVKIIDLSQDFRLNANAKNGDRKFVYGLPELNKEAIKTQTILRTPVVLQRPSSWDYYHWQKQECWAMYIQPALQDQQAPGRD
jgi:hypothetical protein